MVQLPAQLDTLQAALDSIGGNVLIIACTLKHDAFEGNEEDRRNEREQCQDALDGYAAVLTSGAVFNLMAGGCPDPKNPAG